MNLTEKQIQQLLSDVEIYKTLLLAWCGKWDTIEEWLDNDATWEKINTLYELTKKETNPATKTKIP